MSSFDFCFDQKRSSEQKMHPSLVLFYTAQYFWSEIVQMNTELFKNVSNAAVVSRILTNKAAKVSYF